MSEDGFSALEKIAQDLETSAKPGWGQQPKTIDGAAYAKRIRAAVEAAKKTSAPAAGNGIGLAPPPTIVRE